MNAARTYRLVTLTVCTLVVVAGWLALPTTVRADRSRKAVVTTDRSAADRKALALLKYGTPVYGAMQASLLAMERQQRPAAKTTVAKPAVASRDADTSRTSSRILSARATGDVVTVRVELQRDEAQVDIGLYNMLGKKVQDVYKGGASRGPHEYTAQVSDLPEGVYICIMQGGDFRRAEKFYLSR
jgi:hypothetical protein